MNTFSNIDILNHTNQPSLTEIEELKWQELIDWLDYWFPHCLVHYCLKELKDLFHPFLYNFQWVTETPSCEMSNAEKNLKS